MLETEVMTGPLRRTLVKSILKLDRANMQGLLDASDIDLPEAERLCRLSDPGTIVVVARSGLFFAGYLEFAPDRIDPNVIYIASLQIAAPHSGGMVVGHLLARAGALISESSPSAIRLQVQRNNSAALKLFAKLGFRVGTAAPGRSTLDAVADPEILSGPLLGRLTSKFTAAQSQLSCAGDSLQCNRAAESPRQTPGRRTPG